MNDRDKHWYIVMTVAAIAAILLLLLYSLMPIPVLPLTARERSAEPLRVQNAAGICVRIS